MLNIYRVKCYYCQYFCNTSAIYIYILYIELKKKPFKTKKKYILYINQYELCLFSL